MSHELVDNLILLLMIVGCIFIVKGLCAWFDAVDEGKDAGIYINGKMPKSMVKKYAANSKR